MRVPKYFLDVMRTNKGILEICTLMQLLGNYRYLNNYYENYNIFVTIENALVHS